jgi:hypothetical protein
LETRKREWVSVVFGSQRSRGKPDRTSQARRVGRCELFLAFKLNAPTESARRTLERRQVQRRRFRPINAEGISGSCHGNPGRRAFSPRSRQCHRRRQAAHCLLRASVALRLDKGRQLCAFVSDENGNQFGPLGVTLVGGHSMYRAQRLKERLTDIEYLHRSIVEL